MTEEGSKPDIANSELRPMRVRELWIENFRGVEALYVSFPEKGPTVIVGANGAGKSTILEALYICLSRFTSKLSNTSSTSGTIEAQDIRNGSQATSLKVDVAFGRGGVSWIVSKTRKGFPTLRATNLSLMSNLVEDWQNGNAAVDKVRELPFVYYYKVNRSITDIPTRLQKPKDTSRFSIYSAGRSTGSLNFRDFLYWFKDKQHYELQQKVPNIELGLVKDAIEKMVPGYSNPEFIADGSNAFMLTSDAGEKFNISQLSDGERTLITLVADIAKRGAMALEGSADISLESIFGVVIIDEIELHLHPSWQNTIIGRLQETFPNVQFICTTHSPAILTNVADDNSFLLQDGKLFSPDTYGKTSNALLEEVFKSEPAAPEIHNQFTALNQLIAEGKTSEAKILLEKLRLIRPTDERISEAEVLLWMPSE